MANASDTSPYILAAPDSTLPNSRALVASGGIVTQDTGGEGTFTINTVGNLQTLNSFASPGLITYDATVPGIVARSLGAGAGIFISAPDGNDGNPFISVVADSTVQQVNSLSNGLFGSTRSSLNFVPSGSVSVTIADNSLDNRTDINIAGVVAAPEASTYIIQTPDGGLPNAQPLSPLATGLLKVTTGTGVLSHAVADTDYQSASANLTSISAITPDIGSFISGNGTGFTELAVSVTPGDVLTSNGTGMQPSWLPPATGNLVVVLPDPTSGIVTLQTKTTYIATNSSLLLTFHLPAVADAVPGDFYEIIGAGGAGWQVGQNASQQISMGLAQTTIGISGFIRATSAPFFGYFTSDAITIYCVTPTQFVGVKPTGNINFS